MASPCMSTFLAHMLPSSAHASVPLYLIGVEGIWEHECFSRAQQQVLCPDVQRQLPGWHCTVVACTAVLCRWITAPGPVTTAMQHTAAAADDAQQDAYPAAAPAPALTAPAAPALPAAAAAGTPAPFPPAAWQQHVALLTAAASTCSNIHVDIVRETRCWSKTLPASDRDSCGEHAAVALSSSMIRICHGLTWSSTTSMNALVLYVMASVTCCVSLSPLSASTERRAATYLTTTGST